MNRELKLCKNTVLFIVVSIFLIAICMPLEVNASNYQTLEIIHHHTGNENDGGGCYGQENSKKLENCCNKRMTQVDWCTCICQDGHVHTNSVGGGYDMWAPPEYCHVPLGTYYYKQYFTLNCNAEEGAVVATISLAQPSTDWCKSLDLNASYTATDGIVLDGNPIVFSLPGGEVLASTVTVVENGSVTCRLKSSSDNNDATSKIITYNVSNIDNTAPTISAISYEQDDFVKQINISVEALDLQGDGSEGSGIPTESVSIDGGASWKKAEDIVITQNGNYTVLVRDNLGNIASENIEVTKIYVEPPKAPEPPKELEEETAMESEEEIKTVIPEELSNEKIVKEEADNKNIDDNNKEAKRGEESLEERKRNLDYVAYVVQKKEEQSPDKLIESNEIVRINKREQKETNKRSDDEYENVIQKVDGDNSYKTNSMLSTIISAIILLGVSVICTTVIIIGVVLYLRSSTFIFEKSEGLSYAFLGVSRMKNKNEIIISERMLERCGSDSIRLKINVNSVKRSRQDNIIIISPGGEEIYKIKEYIDIKI